MNSVIVDGAASLAAAWPLALLTILVGSLFATQNGTAAAA